VLSMTTQTRHLTRNFWTDVDAILQEREERDEDFESCIANRDAFKKRTMAIARGEYKSSKMA